MDDYNFTPDFEEFWKGQNYPDPSIKEFISHIFEAGWKFGEYNGYNRGYRDAKNIFSKIEKEISNE